MLIIGACIFRFSSSSFNSLNNNVVVSREKTKHNYSMYIRPKFKFKWTFLLSYRAGEYWPAGRAIMLAVITSGSKQKLARIYTEASYNCLYNVQLPLDLSVKKERRRLSQKRIFHSTRRCHCTRKGSITADQIVCSLMITSL